MRVIDSYGRARFDHGGPRGLHTQPHVGVQLPFVPPIDSQWAWINQGSATVTEHPHGVLLSTPSSVGFSLRIRKKAKPTTSTYTIHASIWPGIHFPTDADTGIGFRESSTGRLHVIKVIASGEVYVTRMTNPTTHNSNDFAQALPTMGAQAPRQFALYDDGSTYYFYAEDGWGNAALLYSVAHGTWLTPNEVCWFLHANGTTSDVYAMLLSWEETE